MSVLSHCQGTLWSGTGTLVAIISEDVLRFDRETCNDAIASGVEIGDEGVVAAFEVVAEVSERCVSVCSLNWLADILPTVSRLPVGRRLLHLYQLSRPTELSRRDANEYHYPFRYVSRINLCIPAFPNAPQPHLPAWLHSGS